MVHIDDPATQKANLAYIHSSMQEPLLSRQDELAYAQKWREEGDQNALHLLVRSYRRLVVSIAKKFRHYGLPAGDLVQEGNVGLMQAAARFEPSREVRFSTYALWWIRAAMQDYVLRNWSIVRTGTTAAQKALFFNLHRLQAKIQGAEDFLSMTRGQKHQIAESLGVRLCDVTQMEMRLSGGDQSLHMPVAEDGTDYWQNFIPDDRPLPEEIVRQRIDGKTRLEWLDEAIGRLNLREQSIIRKRRLSEEGATLEQLGQELGISKERIRQLENRALEKLKQSMSEYTDCPQDLFLDQ